jgi:hypothetical protein
MSTASETPPISSTAEQQQPGAEFQSSETIRLESLPTSTVGALEQLDYACRSRAIPRAIALPGHYMAFRDAGGTEQVVEIGDQLVHLGRSRNAEIRIEDVHVSRRHAILTRRADTVRILDDGSSTGTFVNGQRVIATNLTDGDVVRLGTVSFTYLLIR